MKRINALMQARSKRIGKRRWNGVSNMEWNVKRFNEKCKRNYIIIITVEYQCKAEMEDNIR